MISKSKDPSNHDIPWYGDALKVAKGFEKRKWGRCNIYIVLIRDPDVEGGLGLYVGQTALPPEDRFEQHKDGYKAS